MYVSAFHVFLVTEYLETGHFKGSTFVSAYAKDFCQSKLIGFDTMQFGFGAFESIGCVRDILTIVSPCSGSSSIPALHIPSHKACGGEHCDMGPTSSQPGGANIIPWPQIRRLTGAMARATLYLVSLQLHLPPFSFLPLRRPRKRQTWLQMSP